MTRFLSGLGLVFACLLVSATAAELLPPAPKAFFNDNADLVPVSVASRLNEQLAQFERDSSNQLLVVIYPTLTSDSSMEDFANRAFQAWGVGGKAKDNGAVLFVFVQDRKMRIEVGYGLEPTLTDAACFSIIEEMKPHFRSGDYATGLSNAVTSMIAATRGEYTGTGKTLSEGDATEGLIILLVIAFILFFALWNFISHFRQIQKGYYYGPDGRKTISKSPSYWSTSSSGSSSDSWGDSGGSSFSGGGGSSGGGGASGGW
jgi:uncharacterized protein